MENSGSLTEGADGPVRMVSLEPHSGPKMQMDNHCGCRDVANVFGRDCLSFSIL
jgi:hypothetical protein